TPATVTITASQVPAAGGTLSASTPFTVAAANSGPSATDGSTPVTLNQVVAEAVTGVPQGLIASEAVATGNADSTDVTMSGTTLNGVTQIANGTLNPETVIDERGTLVGWSSTAVLETDFIGPGTIGSHTWDNVIPGDFLSWSPNLTIPVTDGVPDG